MAEIRSNFGMTTRDFWKSISNPTDFIMASNISETVNQSCVRLQLTTQSKNHSLQKINVHLTSDQLESLLSELTTIQTMMEEL